MWRFLLYLFPAIANMFIGGVFFITAYRFSEAHANKLLVTGCVAMWGILYSLLSLLVGKITTTRRAPTLLILACLLLFGSAWGFVLFPALGLQYLWVAVASAGFALYCVPFQIFSKDLEEGKSGGTARAAALYTVAWSVGLACGPLLFGLMTDWKKAFAFLSLLPILVIAVVLLVKCLRKNRSATAQQSLEIEPEFRDKPDLVRVGWIGGFLGTIAVSIIRSLEPNLAVELQLPQLHAGLILALVSYIQATVALALVGGKKWMYQKRSFLLCGVLGMTGLLLYAFAHTLPLLYLGSVLYGTCSGIYYFLVVFHAQVNPRKNTQYVAVTETLVGLANVGGPLLGGWIAQHTSLAVTFTAAAALTLVMGLLQAIECRRVARR